MVIVTKFFSFEHEARNFMEALEGKVAYVKTPPAAGAFMVEAGLLDGVKLFLPPDTAHYTFVESVVAADEPLNVVVGPGDEADIIVGEVVG